MKAIPGTIRAACCTNSPSLKINGQVTDLPVFLSLLHTVAALRILLCESAQKINQSQINALCLFNGDLRWRTAWGCNGKALTEARA